MYLYLIVLALFRLSLWEMSKNNTYFTSDGKRLSMNMENVVFLRPHHHFPSYSYRFYDIEFSDIYKRSYTYFTHRIHFDGTRISHKCALALSSRTGGCSEPDKFCMENRFWNIAISSVSLSFVFWDGYIYRKRGSGRNVRAQC